MQSLLVEVTPTDAQVFLAAALATFAIALTAACAPVYQSTRVDPVRVLRG
jgi:ABC-type lipoprotein release transport system permease subunit